MDGTTLVTTITLAACAVCFCAGMAFGVLLVRGRLARMRKAAELLLNTLRADTEGTPGGVEPDTWPCSCSPLDEDDRCWGCPRCRLVRAGLLPPDPAKPRGPVSPDDDIPF